MNKLITIIFITMIIPGAWWFWTSKSDTEPTVQSLEETAGIYTSESTNEPNNEVGIINRQPFSPDRQVYINQDWRFSFEYPAGWEVRESAFGSKASLFNMELVPEEPRFPDVVLINVTPKWWIDRLLEDIKNQKNVPAVVTVDDREAIVSSYTYMSIPSKQYILLINDEYWIDISGRLDYGKVQGYEKELNIVLDTFKFHEPLPYLKDLDVEPYMPDYVKTQPVSSD